MSHDQVWKDLLKQYFGDFLELFLPGVAEHIDLSGVEFADSEAFTDIPEGSRRQADLVARVRSRSGEPKLVLVHVEIQSKDDASMPRRMWQYYHALRFRYGIPVLPILIYLSRRGHALRRERYVDELFGETYATVRYWALSLPEFSADRFLRSSSALGPAVSAIMRSGRRGPVHHKLQALHRIATAPIDDASRSLLAHVVGKYLRLTARQEEELDRLVRDTGAVEVAEMVNIYEQRGLARGREEGREEGREMGIQEGKALGILMGEARGMQRSLLFLLEGKFGPVPGDVRKRVEAIDDTGRLSELMGRILDVNSLEEMGL